jgi:hypothetical protein
MRPVISQARAISPLDGPIVRLMWVRSRDRCAALALDFDTYPEFTPDSSEMPIVSRGIYEMRVQHIWGPRQLLHAE